MKGFFGFLGFVTILIVLVAAFALPALVAPAVASEVRAASPFGEQAIDVDVDLNALGLIRGLVGEIRVSGTDLEQDGVAIGSLDVAARNVGIGDHAVGEVSGGLESVSIPTAAGGAIFVRDIALSGSSSGLTATARLDREAAIAFIEQSFVEQGVAASDVELTSGGISLIVFDQRVEVAIGVQDGAFVIPDMLGAGTFEILAPQPDDPWRLTGAVVSPNGLELVAAVDASRLLASS